MGVQLTKNSIDLGIVTTNGPAMLAFYRDIVGLKYLREMPMPGGGVMHQMLCGDSVIKLVALEKTQNAATPGGIQASTGYRYWTMTVSNQRAVVDACTAAGIKIIIANRELRPGVRIAMVEDPDGNWVEFLTLDPAGTGVAT